jgi:hypothetical protein
MADVSPMTLVSEARSHSVCSSGAGLELGQSMRPTAYWAMMPSWLPTTAIAPGKVLSARARSSTRITVSRIAARASGATSRRFTTYSAIIPDASIG